MNGLILSPSELEYYRWASSLLKKSKFTSVVGDWAMGKSTFALNLNNVTKQDVVHLNLIRDSAPFQKMPIEHSNYLYKLATKNGNCILDGNAVDLNFDERLDKSEVIVFFDGDVNDIVSNFMARLARVLSGAEKRIGAHEFSGTESFNTVKEILTEEVKIYEENKEKIIRPKLQALEKKVITVKDQQGRFALNTVIDF